MVCKDVRRVCGIWVNTGSWAGFGGRILRGVFAIFPPLPHEDLLCWVGSCYLSLVLAGAVAWLFVHGSSERRS